MIILSALRQNALRLPSSLRGVVWLTLLLLGVPALAQDMGRGGGPGPRQPVPVVPATGAADVILGRPTDMSMTLSLLRYDHDGAVVVTYRPENGNTSLHTNDVRLKKDEPQEMGLEKLQANTPYAYDLKDAANSKVLASGSFRTQRPRGSPFTFTLTSDSHLDGNTEPALFQRTLANALADGPDFHIDLGDTFMTGKHETRENATQQYLAQRTYFGQLGRSAPLFLVIGNHDGEENKPFRGEAKSRRSQDGGDTLSVWSSSMRKHYFPNPVPDAFYTGNRNPHPIAGPLQDYYAWTWGDALFIVLDPYWYSSQRRGEEPWGLSLGNEQYQWLKRTLEASKARFKFVFVHQLVGGFDRNGRGGTEAAGFGEWGGRNADGSEGFKQQRPGWDMPIHQLLVRHGASAVFHGHDHLYATQTLDGIVYQEVPQPGHPGQGVPRFAAEYGYREGVILGGAGHLRVAVSPDKVTVDFVRTATGAGNALLGHSYTISPKR